MKFGDLIEKHTWNDICFTFMQLYPDEKKNLSGYKQAYEELHTLRPVKTKMRILLEDFFDEYDKRYYTHLCGMNGTLNKEDNPEYFKDDEAGNREISWAIEFTPWEEWLGMEIDPYSIERYNELQIISHCLYEMTFAGFDQDTIKKEIGEVERSVKEFKNMTDEERKKRLVPYETVKKKYGKK